MDGEASSSSDESVFSLLETHVLNHTHIVLTTLGSAGGKLAVESVNKFKVVVIDEVSFLCKMFSLLNCVYSHVHSFRLPSLQSRLLLWHSVSGLATQFLSATLNSYPPQYFQPRGE